MTMGEVVKWLESLKTEIGKSEYRSLWHYAETIDTAIESLADRPTGEWALKGHLWECDQCGCRINRAKPLKGNIWNYNYCPNCGANMRGEQNG